MARPDSYSFATVTLTGTPFVTESGLKITPECALHDLSAIDTLIVPGGAGLRPPGVAEEIAEALRHQAPGCRRVVAVCTGIYALARSGLLDGGRRPTGVLRTTSHACFRRSAWTATRYSSRTDRTIVRPE